MSDCLVVCPSTYYNTSGICTPCVSPCYTCTDYHTCTACENGTYLYQNQCLTQCPTGMAVINGDTCLVCPSTCKTCSSLTFCISCYTSTYLYNGTCLPSCPVTLYPNVTTNNCDTCTSPCSTCTNLTNCLSCLDTTKFLVGGTCVPCSSPCASCTITITNCTSCLTNTSTPYYHSYSCLILCPSNYYSDNSTYQCSLCASPCLTCNGVTNSSCLSC